jgi:hypothetical protein
MVQALQANKVDLATLTDRGCFKFAILVMTCMKYWQFSGGWPVPENLAWTGKLPQRSLKTTEERESCD